jgi:hypothetical protein
MATGVRRSGEFCWINILTSRPGEARKFFSELFGWTYKDLPEMGGGIFSVGAHEVGGMWDLDAPGTPPGTPAGIGVTVKIDDADAAAEKVRSLGGQAQPPMDIMTNGRMVACTDPLGASFDLWEAGDQPGTTADTSNHGVPSWSELLTNDPARAREFYESLFGWTSSESDIGDMKYTTFKLGDDFVAGMMQLSPEMSGMPTGWSTYFTVTDVDATVEKAAAQGSHVFMPAMDVPTVGRMAGLVSPQGVTFYVIRYTP